MEILHKCDEIAALGFCKYAHFVNNKIEAGKPPLVFCFISLFMFVFFFLLLWRRDEWYESYRAVISRIFKRNTDIFFLPCGIRKMVDEHTRVSFLGTSHLPPGCVFYMHLHIIMHG